MDYHFGDSGYTKDFQGRIIPKNSDSIMAIGNIDELIAQLGLIRYIAKEEAPFIKSIQMQLSSIMAQLANYPQPKQFLSLQELDNQIEQIKSQHPPIKEFYIPGDQEKPIFINIARTICRRCERSVCHLANPHPNSITFLNRLSAYLFHLQIYYHHQKTQ